MQTTRQQIVGKLTQLFLKSMMASFPLLASIARADALADGCNLILAGNFDDAISAFRKATLVLNESPTNDLEHEFSVISGAGSAKALAFLAEDSKAGKFPLQDCKTAAEAMLALQQGQFQLATTKLQPLLGKHPSNPMILVLASGGQLRMFKHHWYAEIDGDKELRELFRGINDSERRSLVAFFLMNNAFYQLRSASFDNAYNDFYAAIEYAPAVRAKAVCHLGALVAGKQVIQGIRRNVVYFLAGRLLDREEFRSVLAEHRSSLEAMRVKIPGSLSLPLSARTWAIIGGIAAVLGYSYWCRKVRSQ